MLKRSIAALLLMFSVSFSAVYHVTTSGSNETGDGSSAKPWATLAHACSKVGNDTVQLSAGTFIEQSTSIDLPEGISILGAGPDKTTIHCQNPAWAEFAPDQFFFRMRSETFTSRPSLLRGFTIDGIRPGSDSALSNVLSGGLVIDKRRQVTITNCEFKSIAWSAIWLKEADSCLIDSSTFVECARETDAYSSGAIQPSFVKDVEIRNFTITAHRPGTGYGIVGMGFGIPRAAWKRVNIHHGTIDLKGTAAWQSGTAANIAIEANLTWPIEECEIHHCTINSNVSFPGGQQMQRTGKPTLRFHNNTIPLLSVKDAAQTYALELSLDDCEVDHNFIEGGSWFISGPYEPRANFSIHHNIIRNQFSEWQWSLVTGLVTDLWVYNNVWVWEEGEPDWSIIGLKGPVNGLVFQNNVVQVSDSVKNTTGRTIRFIESATWDTPRTIYPVSNLVVRNNLYYNASANSAEYEGTWENNVNAVAQWTATGSISNPWYTPSGASSNLVDAGLAQGIEGIEYRGNAPDIGAFEYLPPTHIRIPPKGTRPLQQGTSFQYDLQGRRVSFTDSPLGRIATGVLIVPNNKGVTRRLNVCIPR